MTEVKNTYSIILILMPIYFVTFKARILAALQRKVHAWARSCEHDALARPDKNRINHIVVQWTTLEGLISKEQKLHFDLSQ